MAGSGILFFTNMRFSVEFTGGMNVRVATQLADNFVSNTEQFLADVGYADAKVAAQVETNYSDIVIATDVSDDTAMNVLADKIKSYLLEQKIVSQDAEIIQLSVTGPSVGSYMQSAAIRAIVIGLLFMTIYMLFAFATIRKFVPPTILAIVTIVTMFFDVFTPAGAYWLLMWINPTVQINTIFIVAILTTMWYSINDTIVIFDRVRENVDLLWEGAKNVSLAKVFESSLRQSMRRSLMTGGATLLVIVTMYIFGTGDMRDFAFTMGIGILSGTYSSIFIAAPLAYLLLRKKVVA